MRVEWDARKAAANLRKHEVSFDEASTALDDPLAATVRDPDHSDMEHRFITFGVSTGGRLLVVAHAEEEDLLRIISARLATRPERRIYEDG
ncbi:MAG TPA: BrnT family toxin [Thermoanaerobaculia bacterium]